MKTQPEMEISVVTTTEIEPLPRSVEHRVSPMASAILAFTLATATGLVGYGFGILHRTPDAEVSGLFRTIVAGGPEWVATNALCQKKHQGYHFGYGLTAREFCEATVFNVMLNAVPTVEALKQ